jgi:polyphosphate kinase 2 (PPK2 family)
MHRNIQKAEPSRTEPSQNFLTRYFVAVPEAEYGEIVEARERAEVA